jgi:hypothetical protein
MTSNRPLGVHSPRGEWGRQVEIDRSLGLHSLTGEWVTLSNERVGSTEDGIRSTSWVALSNERVGSTEDRIRSTTWSTGSTKDVTRLTT